MAKQIDVRGKLCPEPLIITKRAIKASSVGDSFVVVLDNDVATCNLENYLKELKIEFTRVKNGSDDNIFFTIGAKPAVMPNVEGFCEVAPTTSEAIDNYVVVISANSMGKDDDGSATLGKMLLRGFVNALSEQDKLPKTVILYNSGVLIAVEGADTVESLRNMKQAGVDIILCGVCVDYYSVKEKIAVGRISNMMEITKVTSLAHHVVYP